MITAIFTGLQSSEGVFYSSRLTRSTPSQCL